MKLSIAALLAISALTVVEACAEGLVVHVAASGSDANAGTKEMPFATLVRARDRVRELKQAKRIPPEGVVVEVGGGLYEVTDALELGEEDSGTATAPVVYRARTGCTVRISGGRVLEGFQPVTDPVLLARLPKAARGKVVWVDLKAAGITQYGSLSGGGFRTPKNKLAELFLNDRPMSLSRWPNDGLVQVGEMRCDSHTDSRGRKAWRRGVFTYDYKRPARWVDEPDIHLHGWWRYDWAEERHKIASIDTTNRIITLADPQHTYGYRTGMWYYAFNALCEIDRPGEWCIDRKAGRLFLWPPSPVAEGRVAYTQTNTLVRIRNASHVAFERFVFENSRSTAFAVTGGAQVHVRGCTFRNLGGYGVSIYGGARHRVEGCDIYGTGEGGIALHGGNRKKLVASGHVAENNHIHHFARLIRLLKPGISMGGVGVRARHNLIHNAPHMAIQFGGNDHLIEYNEIHSVCYESNDAGAIYAGRDWAARGNVIRHNYLHHVNGFEGRGCVGIYLDDNFSSAAILGNVFLDVSKAAFIGGGRDNTIENNIFVDCRPALHVDARGLGWRAYGEADLTRKLEAFPYKSDLWRQRYPEMQSILEDDRMAPKGNRIMRNICWGGAWDTSIDRKAKPFLTFTDNTVATGLPFLETTYQLRPDSPAWKAGFKPIPFGKIGLYESSSRASWPVIHTVRPRGVRGGKVGAISDDQKLRVAPTFPVVAAAATPHIDGILNPNEWNGLDPSRGERVGLGIKGEPRTPRSTAWIMSDANALYVAVDNAVNPTKPLKCEPVWGRNDAVELAFRATCAAGKRPIIVYRGYPDGTFESSPEAGASEAQAKRAAVGVRFAARVIGAGRWTAEWRIPFAAVGVVPGKTDDIRFNLSVRKTGDDLWLMWCGTHHATWNVDKAGRLVLPTPRED